MPGKQHISFLRFHGALKPFWYHYCWLEWDFKPSLWVKTHPFSLQCTSVSSSSFYLSFFLPNFFRLLLTQLERETKHIHLKCFRLIFYRISKRGHSDCWFRCGGRNRSLSSGVNCVLRAMRGDKDKVIFFPSFLLSNGIDLLLHFCLKQAVGECV